MKIFITYSYTNAHTRFFNFLELKNFSSFLSVYVKIKQKRIGILSRHWLRDLNRQVLGWQRMREGFFEKFLKVFKGFTVKKSLKGFKH